MSKFNPGDFVLIYVRWPSKDPLAEALRQKYNGTIAEILKFHGNVQLSNLGFLNEGDWYELRVEDDDTIYVREHALHKLPPENTIVSMNSFWAQHNQIFDYRFFSRKVEHAKQV